MKKTQAVLFDMDGVLFDSMPYHAEAWHKTMKAHGLNLSREEAYMHEGRDRKSTRLNSSHKTESRMPSSA